jgi:hypothetical protein
MTSSQREGDAYHVQLMSYLNKLASETLFNNYFLSDYYIAPAVAIDRNRLRIGVVGF